MRPPLSVALSAAWWARVPLTAPAEGPAGGSSGPGSGLEVAAALTCEFSPRGLLLRQHALANARAGFPHDAELGSLADALWTLWSHRASGPAAPLAPGTLATARALIRDGAALEDYCLPAHAAAGFFVARSMHVAFADAVGRPNDPEVGLPHEVLQDLEDVLIKSVMLLGHNRLLDLGKVAGWPVGAAEILEVRAAVQRACRPAPASAQAEEQGAPCTAGGLEVELGGSLANLLRPLVPSRWPGHPLEPLTPWSAGVADTTVPRGCRARVAAGGPPCNVRVWYLGTHEALFREVETMWGLLSVEFRFDIFRLNQQGIYKPGDMPAESVAGQAPVDGQELPLQGHSRTWSPEKKLAFRLASEEILDIQPAAEKLRWLIRRQEATDPGAADLDATLLLCTIPAFSCSAFAELPMPVVMYSANPATAQAPFPQQDAWLSLLADFAAKPKNQLLVSNSWSQAQFEYQLGISLPVIRVHGLYTGTKHVAGVGGAHATEVLVYDRTSPLLSCALEALLQSEGGAGPSKFPTRFVHHASTDRKYATFAAFSAVVFVPGDVEQMAFYEFYSMELPVFVPADPGRFMWPRLPAPGSLQDGTCGPYAAWVGTWELRYASGELQVLSVDCAGRAELEGGGAGLLRPLKLMDERGFTHCLRLPAATAQKSPSWRLRLFPEQLQGMRLDGEDGCSGSLPAAAGADVTGPAAGESPQPNFVEATRRAGEPVPPQPVIWDHDIFASVAWYLDARLGGPSRAVHSPFNLDSFAAAQEWAVVMDYFRFPGVGKFISSVELVAALAAEGSMSLGMAAREMRAFNERGLRRSLGQWRVVLGAAVL